MTAILRATDRVARVQRSRLGMSILGIVLSALLIGSVVMILELFTGHFTRFVTVRAEISGHGNAVGTGNSVVYRDVTVGTVASDGSLLPDHNVVVELHIRPGLLSHIPANVTATVEPVTIFGTEYVVLQLPGGAAPARATLAADQLIAPATSSGGANVQGTITSLDQILNALHPAQLDSALTAVATALDGQGTGLGHTLVTIDGYLREMLPQLPQLETDLQLLAPLANQVAASAPALVGSLSNLTVTAATISSHAAEVHQILAGGSVVSNQLTNLLRPTESDLIAVLQAAGPFLHDLSLTPTEQHDILTGLGTWASAWSSAEASGPYLSFSASIPLANANDLVFGALDAPGTAGPGGYGAGALGAGSVDPATYTSAPTYGPASLQAAERSVRIQPAILTVAEEHAAASLTSTLAEGRPAPTPAVSTLLLAPVLSSMELGS